MEGNPRNPSPAPGNYEVCILGSGPAGLAVVARLIEKGRDVLVLERPAAQRPWGGESFTGAIRAPLQALGFWDAFTRAGHTVGFERQSAWGGEPRADSSIFQPLGPQWHVDRERFDQDLHSAVQQRANVFLSYRRLRSVTKVSGTWRLELDGDDISGGDERSTVECSAKYLVDATGRARLLARRLGARVVCHDRLIGLTAAVSRHLPERDSSDVEIRAMMLEAREFGWWYAAPTPKGHIVALFTDPDLASKDIRRQFRVVAANSVFTHPQAGEGWMPVGDACASHDPLCGWGVHRALDNGIRLADAIDRFLSDGSSAWLGEFHDHCERQYQAYLKGLSERYALERRWPSAPFWKRRQPMAA
jgi:flavin-dependent dehydrogenase